MRRGTMVFRFFRRSANRALIDRLSGEIVAAARHPALFTGYGIADSVDGRFEALTLHAALVLGRLNRMPPPGPEMAQDLSDSIFRSFDAALRERGVGDMSVPKHMKTLAGAFLGRAAAYDRALDGGAAGLSAALLRNVLDGRGNPDRLARYVAAAGEALSNASLDEFTGGGIPFPDPSAIP
ncbi:MAG: ubiquinol-cytochrome c chaperone [Beijerinckiaceae bacterium]|nr:ubiquinol-cytochrome c chaperone [Beijerinckiaceae bacterium]